MDRTGCKPGFASDRIASIYTKECDTSMVTFGVVVGITLAVRLLLTYIQIRISWITTQRKREKQLTGEAGGDAGNNNDDDDGKRDRCKRIMLCGLQRTTYFEFLTTIIMFIFFFLYGFNLIGEFNSLGIPVFGLACATYFGGFAFSCLKLIHLGKRIIPRGMRGNDSEDTLSSLAGDKILTFFFVSFIISSILFSIFLIFVEYFERDKTDLWIKVGICLMGFADTFGMAVITYQTLRVVWFIEASMKEVQNMQNGPNLAVKRTAYRFKMRLIGQSIVLSPSTIAKFFIAAGYDVINFNYIMMIIWASIICSIFATYMFIPRNFSLFPSFGSNKSKSSKNKSSTTPSNELHVKKSNLTPGEDNNAHISSNKGDTKAMVSPLMTKEVTATSSN